MQSIGNNSQPTQIPNLTQSASSQIQQLQKEEQNLIQSSQQLLKSLKQELGQQGSDHMQTQQSLIFGSELIEQRPKSKLLNINQQNSQKSYDLQKLSMIRQSQEEFIHPLQNVETESQFSPVSFIKKNFVNNQMATFGGDKLNLGFHTEQFPTGVNNSLAKDGQFIDQLQNFTDEISGEIKFHSPSFKLNLAPITSPKSQFEKCISDLKLINIDLDKMKPQIFSQQGNNYNQIKLMYLQNQPNRNPIKLTHPPVLQLDHNYGIDQIEQNVEALNQSKKKFKKPSDIGIQTGGSLIGQVKQQNSLYATSQKQSIKSLEIPTKLIKSSEYQSSQRNFNKIANKTLPIQQNTQAIQLKQKQIGDPFYFPYQPQSRFSKCISVGRTQNLKRSLKNLDQVKQIFEKQQNEQQKAIEVLMGGSHKVKSRGRLSSQVTNASRGSQYTYQDLYRA